MSTRIADTPRPPDVALAPDANAFVFDTADRPAPGPRRVGPIAPELAPSRLRIFRLAAAVAVFGPYVGAAAALALAATRGIHAYELVALAIAYPLTTLGVTLGFHRFFSHRTFQAPRWLQVLFVIFGSMALQGPLMFWASTHRRHHRYSDTADDPHSPHHPGADRSGYWSGLWHAHVGWLFARRLTNWARFAPDLLRDRLIFRLQGYYWGWAILGLAIPPAIGFAATGDGLVALECFLWAGPVRLVILQNASWGVASFSHLHGVRPFDTGDHSANNYFVAVFSFGEGLQNNHHAFPESARHGLRLGEPDLTGWVIDLLEATGLIHDVVHPKPDMIRARRLAGKTT
jgi:stearoyl-CoA desaturase (delta-9 desaturase)